jgi:hypothetical protein
VSVLSMIIIRPRRSSSGMSLEALSLLTQSLEQRTEAMRKAIEANAKVLEAKHDSVLRQNHGKHGEP